MQEKSTSVLVRNKDKNLTGIQIRIFLVITAVALIIITLGLTAGGVFLNQSISRAIEDDMLVAVDVGDLYVTNEIELLKMKATEAAREIRELYGAGLEGTVRQVCLNFPVYIGLAVFNDTSLIDYWGEVEIQANLYEEAFMRSAMRGIQAVSTTMFTPCGSLVMYVSAQIDENLALAAVLPGLYFSDRISKFKFWQSGHFFIDDEDGYVISNYRREWVQERVNFINEDPESGTAAMVRRRIAGERGIVRLTIDGISYICAFRPISSQTENWFIGIAAPLSESALGNIPRWTLIAGMSALLLSLIAAFCSAKLLKKPYEQIDNLRKEAEIASVTKSTFLANMSHEIRTPMNSIIGFSELALDDEMPPKIKDFIERIHKNAHWLLQIINDILDLSKIESGKMELESIPFDIHDIFSGCRTLLLSKAVEKGIMLYFYAEPSLGKKPLGDPTRLRQVFINLLSNAIKFTNTGMVKLHSDILKMDENTITMRFEVKDSGIGMTSEQVKKIFEPFTQANSDTTRKYGGTGLGLTITKNIVEMMGGVLSVESSIGVGTKFSFDLTFNTINDDSALQNVSYHADDHEKPIFEGEILLCEDNTLNQQVICEHLSRVGVKAVVADNGKIGLDMVKDRIKNGGKNFDLIFMDMHMPVMDGLEASSEIFKLGTNTPIVAMTANIMTGDREIYKSCGMNDCVGKPFTSQELWSCLRKYLKVIPNDGAKQKDAQQDKDTELRMNINRMFLKNNLKKGEEITDALKDGDLKLAHRLSHTLKSNAAYIGKKMLEKTAADLEESLDRCMKEGTKPAVDNILKTLCSELSMVLNELQFMQDSVKISDNGTKENINLESENARLILDKLTTLLKNGNPECVELVNEVRSIEGAGELASQIEDFEFEKALLTLEKIYERMVA